MIRLLDGPRFEAASKELAGRDEHIEAILRSHGLPPFWHRPPTFATLVLFIIEQQVSLASAKAVFDRMAATIGEVRADTVAGADPEILRSAGLTRQKLRYITELAEVVVQGELDLNGLAADPDDEVRRQLVSLVGIGPWTADVYLLSALRRPDVWPVGDRALQVGVGERLGLGETPASEALVAIGERWRPYRSVAARLIWHDYLQKRGRSETVVQGLTPSHSPGGLPFR